MGTSAIDGQPSAASTSGRTAALLLTGILVAHALLAWQLVARDIFTIGDDAAYLLLSRALRALSYREIHLVGEPIAARFPPVYPALLAMTGERLAVVGLLGIAFSVSGIWALFDVVRRRWNQDAALVSAALVAISPALLDLVAVPQSETVYTSLTLWTLWAVDRVDLLVRRDRGQRSASAGGTVLAVGLGVLAAMTRSAGVTLSLALICHWVWRRQWRAVAVAVAMTGVVVGGWLAWTSFAPAREVRLSYIDDVVRPDVVSPAAARPSLVRVFADRLARNVPTYTMQVSLTQLSLPVSPRTKLDNVGWIVVLGGLLLVGLISAWKRWNAAAIYLLGYFALLALWPFMLERFLVPLVPLALTFIVIGAWTVGPWLRVRRDLAVAVVAVVLAFFALRADAALVTTALDCDRTRAACASPSTLDFVDASRLARTLTPPTARFISPKSPAMYYHAGRQAVFWEEAIQQDSASFLPYIRGNGVTHILSSPVYADYERIRAMVAAHCARFALVRSLSPRTLILAFRDSTATESEGSRACLFIRRAIDNDARYPRSTHP